MKRSPPCFEVFFELPAQKEDSVVEKTQQSARESRRGDHAQGEDQDIFSRALTLLIR